jgi:hypothetical protein
VTGQRPLGRSRIEVSALAAGALEHGPLRPEQRAEIDQLLAVS